jgi:predicted negative regulator of RcsB-dependent stress response
VLQELGWLVEAEADLREAVSKRSNDPVMKRNLASVLVDRGKLEEAEQSIGLAKEQWAEKDGGWRLDDLESLRGEVLAARGRYAEAQPVLLDSYDRLTASESANRRNVQEALERIIRLYEAWGKDEAAAEWRAKRPPAALTIVPIDADTASM